VPAQRAATQRPDLLANPRRAAERVVRALSEGPVAVAEPICVRAQLEQILAAIEEKLNGGDPTRIPPGPLDRLGLLRALRRETLNVWSDDEKGLLPMMRAMDDVEAAMPEARQNAIMGQALTPFARELLAEVSHLLRSPLGSIVMLTEMLRGEHLGPLTAAQARQVDIIHRAALGVTSTAHDILTLTEVGDRVRRIEPFSLTETLETIRDILEPIAASKGRSVVIRVDAEAGRQGPRLTVREIMLTLGLHAILDGRQGVGALELSVEDRADDVVSFGVEAHFARGASDDSAQDPSLPPMVFRIDEEGDGFTLSPGALGLAAVADLLVALDSELERGHLSDAPQRLGFRLHLPRA
jgi:signal transduction histidine kinase